MEIIKGEEIKKILNENISKYNLTYQIINKEEEKKILKLNNFNYMISYNYFGVNCLLLFITIDNKQYIFYIEKKNIFRPDEELFYKIIFINNINPKLYDGTIFECIYNIKSQNYIIMEVYKYCGENYNIININRKFLKIKNDLKKNVIFEINHFYKINEYEKLLNNNETTSFQIKGILFSPLLNGKKIIYLFEKNYFNNLNKKTNISNNINVQAYNFLLKEKFKITEIILPFLIKKTDKIDVYKLFYIIKQNNLFFYKKIGIAYIPTKNQSIYLQKLFENNNNLIFDCLYDNENKKWKLLEISKKTIPAIYNDIINYFDKI